MIPDPRRKIDGTQTYTVTNGCAVVLVHPEIVVKYLVIVYGKGYRTVPYHAGDRSTVL